MSSGYEPRWDLEPEFNRDLAYGEEGERLVASLGECGIEVKTKRARDLKFYVETHHDPGRRGEYKPSGINTTQACMWAFVIKAPGVVVFVPTDRIRLGVGLGWGNLAEEKDGDCPTKGRLLSLSQLISEHLDQ